MKIIHSIISTECLLTASIITQFIPIITAVRTQRYGYSQDYKMGYPMMLIGTSPKMEKAIEANMRGRGWFTDALGAVFGQDNSEGGKWKRKNKIRYLYKDPRKNRWEALDRSVPKYIPAWNKTGQLKVLIHGFTPLTWHSSETNIGNQNWFRIGDAIMSQSKGVNVIIVDWTSLSAEPVQRYYAAAASTWYAGEDIGEFLVRLKNNGWIANWDVVHLVGFSLGGHVAGVAGHKVQTQGGGRVGRITGLDPAGPNFDSHGKYPEDTSKVLEKSDAAFVDIIHCNMGSLASSIGGRFGTTVESGHADFYPDGGESQHSCSLIDDRVEACSHNKCTQYFLDSITSKLLACPCSSWKDYKSGKCQCTGKLGGMYMGFYCEPSASGRYFRRMS